MGWWGGEGGVEAEGGCEGGHEDACCEGEVAGGGVGGLEMFVEGGVMGGIEEVEETLDEVVD